MTEQRVSYSTPKLKAIIFFIKFCKLQDIETTAKKQGPQQAITFMAPMEHCTTNYSGKFKVLYPGPLSRGFVSLFQSYNQKMEMKTAQHNFIA